jgi:Ca2+-binding RTX toxin-like protein
VFLGTSAPEHVFGGAGDDNLYGGGGDDHLDGGDGNDWLDGGAGSDTLNGGNGFDTLSYLDATAGVSIVLTELSSTWTWTGDAQDDLLNSIEQIQLSNFADTFRGDANANWALGGAGDDQIFGAGGDDVLYGDAGNDLLDGGAGADTLAGGAGWDIASYQDATAGVGIDLTKASSAWTGDAQGDVMTSIEQIDLSDFADTFRGNASANTVSGGNGADSLDGGMVTICWMAVLAPILSRAVPALTLRAIKMRPRASASI